MLFDITVQAPVLSSGSVLVVCDLLCCVGHRTVWQFRVVVNALIAFNSRGHSTQLFYSTPGQVTL